MLNFLKIKQHVSFSPVVDIKSIENGLVCFGQNQYCRVIEVSSLNFELKSSAEQDALIDTYQGFLNSLGFPLQFLVRTREVDLERYMLVLRNYLSNETNSIFVDQIKAYLTFIENLVTKNKILTKKFYVLIPYIENAPNHDSLMVVEKLKVNSQIVRNGLSRLGLSSTELSSLDVLDLFYSFYNPTTAKTQPISQKAFQQIHSLYVEGASQ